MLKKNAATSGKVENNSPDKLNRVVEQTSIKGDIKSESNFRIDGNLDGTIDIKGRLDVGPSGFIKGEVKCENADIEGTIDGNIKVSEILTLKSTAKIEGNIETGKLAIEPGATFSGSCDMGGKKISSNNNSTSKNTIKEKDSSSEVVY